MTKKTTSITEGAVTLVFLREYGVMKYDESKFFKEKFQRIQFKIKKKFNKASQKPNSTQRGFSSIFLDCGTKAVDFVYVTSDTTWLIEITDYRPGNVFPKPSELADEILQKVRDTLAGLAAASANADNHEEKEIAQRALEKQKWCVALHLEQPPVQPQVINPSSVSDKLCSRLTGIAPEGVTIVNLERMQSMNGQLPWKARETAEKNPGTSSS